MSPGDRLVHVFISYAHEDRKWCTRLRDQLGALVNLGHIHLFDDGEIGAGEKWDDRIRQELEAADIIVLIVSDKFMASKYSTTIELQHAVEGHASRSVCVIPVVADHVDTDALPFHDLQFFPLDENRDLKPLAEWKEEVSRPLADVARSVRKEAERIKGTAATAAEQPARVRPPRPRQPRPAWRAPSIIGGAVLIVVAAFLLWRSQLVAPMSEPPSVAAPSSATPTSAPTRDAGAENTTRPTTEPERPASQTGAGTGTRAKKRVEPVAKSDPAREQPSVAPDQPAGGASAQPAAPQTPPSAPPPSPPDPENVRRQLFARASAVVECVQGNQDEASARRILRILHTMPTSETTRGIMADLKNAWPGGTEKEHRAITSDINCIPKRP
ncbi:hypothetical protein LuPra_02368 [Luteitalea pratensis]|uniref:TIR domain-containing protein n=1 Tax=Luteitalea pratensis TaxID=1855912 RepID=A0A143PKQ7_LUTPR|nr:toll/interleukin-1 receptor domain-containing protein [Luteitalea pratensis]AMY09155.1 hypothetical protein LuPra_02368 [Luteitalea pratensis]